MICLGGVQATLVTSQNVPIGVVAELAVVTGPDIGRRIYAPVKALPGWPPSVRWMAWTLVGIHHDEGPRFVVLPL